MKLIAYCKCFALFVVATAVVVVAEGEEGGKEGYNNNKSLRGNERELGGCVDEGGYCIDDPYDSADYEATCCTGIQHCVNGRCKDPYTNPPGTGGGCSSCPP